jgi:hypothetical protein
MFKPWRNLSELKSKNQTWTECLEVFLSIASKSILNFIENIEFNLKAQNDAEEEILLFKTKTDSSFDENHEIYEEIKSNEENPDFQNLLDLYTDHPELLSADILKINYTDEHLKNALESLSHLDNIVETTSSNVHNKCLINKHSIVEENKISDWKNIYSNINKKLNIPFTI